ncbi:protein muscleblind isoform X3 [Chironomus tepperi]|uniref:protein muscleblind isoform X3 n=1 Tax=Chironomus tepperi TaxID=113505 RepID=UPI00391FC58D
MAAMVNMSNLINGKDSRWLQLEVCREFQRNKCSRPDTECKFAHPAANVEVQNGRVTACYDSIKGRCNREKPPCKYYHPPQHLKDQLLINGRNHLALKNALMQQMGIAPNGQPIITSQLQPMTANAYITGVPASNPYNPYYAPGQLVPTILGPDPSTATATVSPQLGPCIPQPVSMPPQQHKLPRSDRIEMDMKTIGSIYYENYIPGMVPYKRSAAEKSGIPIYQPSATNYQQLMHMQQPFVPISYIYKLQDFQLQGK